MTPLIDTLFTSIINSYAIVLRRIPFYNITISAVGHLLLKDYITLSYQYC